MNGATTGRKRSTTGRLLLWTCVAALVVSGWPRAAPAAEQGQAATAPPKEITVALKEIPVWEVTSARVREPFLRGQYAVTQKHKLLPMTCKCPEFISDAPLYGMINFPEAAPDSRKSVTYFAIDSSVKGGDYNLLYFDDNRDGDLTNDKLRRPFPPADYLARRSSSFQETYFEPVQVKFPSGPEGRQTLELLPCLRIYQGSEPQSSFIAARVHSGAFELSGVSYQAFVGCQYRISGRLDQPSTALLVVPPGGEPATWSGGQQLSATHLLGGRYCRFACTPAGDRLTVQPYSGALGVFEIGSAGPNAGALTVRGSLRSATTSVAVGAVTSDGRTREPTRSWQFPVGDYRIDNLSLQLEGLFALVLNNYHEDGRPMGRTSRQNNYGIAVRADKPFVLKLSAQPQVLFALPPRDQRVTLGEELQIKAVLVDPGLDVMFRVLTRNQQELDPKVVIKRANGEIVAEGTMPFG